MKKLLLLCSLFIPSSLFALSYAPSSVGFSASDTIAISSLNITNISASTITVSSNLKTSSITMNGTSPLVFYGNSGTVISSMTSSGQTLQPNQTFFLVQSTGALDITGDGTTANIGFTTEITDIGSNFSNTTFTAPITGNFQLCAQVTLENILVTHNNLTLQIATTARQYLSIRSGLLARTDETLSMCVIAPMSSGDTAIVKISADSSTKTMDTIADIRYNFFSGKLSN